MASRRFLVVVSGAKIYVAANPLRSDRRKRTKDSIADTVPTPTAVLSTLLGKYQILCRIDSFTFEQQESALKLFAIPFGGDRTSMDCNRGLRWPGFRNCKNDPSYPIPVKYPCDSTSNPGDFRLDIPRQMRWLCPTQSHRESTPASTPIPNTIGRGSCTNLPTEKTPRS
jgi:hypothetical protein